MVQNRLEILIGKLLNYIRYLQISLVTGFLLNIVVLQGYYEIAGSVSKHKMASS